jgi:hypothetical protein
MFRLLGAFLVIVAISVIVLDSSLPRNAITEAHMKPDKSVQLEGVYEFVSESLELTKPQRLSSQSKPSEWVGIWQFQKGFYTRIKMKMGRGEESFPLKFENLGFEAFAGTYEVNGATIYFTRDYAIHPLDVGRRLKVDYQLDGDRLTLTQTLTPILERPTEGIVTITLRKLK